MAMEPEKQGSPSSIQNKVQFIDDGGKANFSRRIVESRKSPNPRRLGGKGKATPLRDLAIFLAIMAALMFLTRNFDIGVKKEGEEEGENEEHVIPNDPVADTLNDVAEKIVKILSGSLDNRPVRADPCDLFLQTGSIPNTGYSLYAGRNFQVGELLPLPSFGASWSISLNDRGLQVVPHAFFISPHRYKFNVEGTLFKEGEWSESPLFRATKNITEGEELYVHWESHPAKFAPSLFESIPTNHDHELAKSIRSDAVLTSKRLVQAQRKKSVRINPAPILSVVRRSVGMVRPQVGALLLEEGRYTTGLLLHQRHSTCPSDLIVSSVEEELSTLRIRFRVTKGTSFAVVPLQKFSSETAEKYSVKDLGRHCTIGGVEWHCPLTVSYEAISRSTTTPVAPNVKIDWALLPGTQKEVTKEAWQLIALEDIEEGSELRFRSDWKASLFPEEE